MRVPTPEELKEISGLRAPTPEELAELAPAFQAVARDLPSVDPLREITGSITQTNALKEFEDIARLKVEDITAALAGMTATAVTAELGPISIPIGMAAAALAGGSTHYAKTGDIKSSLAEGGIQALFEGVPGAWIATRRYSRPLKRFVKDYQVTAMNEFNRVGGHLTLDQMVTSSLVEKFADMSAESFFGGGRLKMFKGETQVNFLKKIWGDVLEDISPGALGTSEPGTVFKGAMDITEKAIKRVSDEMYETLYSAVGDVTIPLVGVEEKLGIKRISSLSIDSPGRGATGKPFTLKTGRAGSGDTELNRVIDDVMDLSETYGGNLPFEEADNLLKGINRELRKATKANNRQAIRKLGEVKKLLKGEVDSVLGSKGLVEHYDYVLEEYGNMASVMRNEFVTKLYRNIAENNPELVANYIKDGRPSDIRRIKDVLLNPPKFGGEQLPANPGAWAAIKRSYLQDRWDSGIVESMVKEKIGRGQLNRLLKLDDESINILFDKGQRARLSRFADAATASLRMGEKGGGMLIQLMQAGALTGLAVGLYTGDIVKGIGAGGAFVLIAPWKMGRMLSDRKFVELMTTGLSTPTRTDAVATLLPRLYRRFAELSVEDERGPSIMVPMEDLGAFEGPGQIMFGGQFEPSAGDDIVGP